MLPTNPIAEVRLACCLACRFHPSKRGRIWQCSEYSAEQDGPHKRRVPHPHSILHDCHKVASLNSGKWKRKKVSTTGRPTFVLNRAPTAVNPALKFTKCFRQFR